jgi:hypothetical protein
MRGHLVNKSNMWKHIMRRAVEPNGKIPLQDLYMDYGMKYEVPKDQFITWLYAVKIKDKEVWAIEK